MAPSSSGALNPSLRRQRPPSRLRPADVAGRLAALFTPRATEPRASMDRGKDAIADSFSAATAMPFLLLCCQRMSPASLPRRPIKRPASGYDSAPPAIWLAPEPKRPGRMRHKSRSETIYSVPFLASESGFHGISR
uniref:Uncharacterized protein n=1 Tax=Oryza punctata TaxID=4537 RepID=A0A0E0LCE0_ORYPU